MNKDLKTIVTEYGQSLSDEELRWLSLRMTERHQGDLSDAINMLCRSKRIDSILSSASTFEEFFNFCDRIRDVLSQLCKKKGLIKSRHRD